MISASQYAPLTNRTLILVSGYLTASSRRYSKVSIALRPYACDDPNTRRRALPDHVLDDGEGQLQAVLLLGVHKHGERVGAVSDWEQRPELGGQIQDALAPGQLVELGDSDDSLTLIWGDLNPAA